MDGILVLARLILAGVLILAALTKLGDRPGSRQALTDFGVPPSLVASLATMLPLVELGAGLALVPVASAWWGALAALVLFTVFLAAIGYQLARGRRPDCHCFGQLHSAPIGWTTVVRNLVLAALAGVIVARPGRDPGPSVLALLDGVTPVVGLSLGLAVVAVIAAAVNGWLLTNLVQQNGRLLLRLDALEARLPASPGSGAESAPVPAPSRSIGLPAPAFTLPSLGGASVTLDQLRSNGTPLLLLFMDPGCGPCEGLLPEVSRWQREHADRLGVAIISRGTRQRNEGKFARAGIGRVLLQEGDEVSTQYSTEATPSAIVVDGAGRIASPVAAGADAIRRLVERYTRAERPDSASPVVGTAAPGLRLPAIDGTAFDLGDRIGRPTVLLFWNPGCGFCRRLLPELRAWAERAPAAADHLVFVSTPDRDANREPALPGMVLLDDGFEAGRAFGAGGTPTAALVDASGRIGAPLAVGGEAVLGLLTSVDFARDALRSART